MEIEFEGEVPHDPRERVLMLEAVVRTICESIGEDPAEGTMMLLTAAAHMARKYSRPGVSIERTLAETLGAAIVAADEFFKLRNVS